jgi:hypothetical protein
MAAIVEAISDVGEAVGNVVGAVGTAVSDVVKAVDDNILQPAVKVVDNTVQAALKDPIGTAAKVAAVATGHPELLPLISAADAAAHGASLEQIVTSAAISQISSGVGGEFAEFTDSALAGQAAAGATSAVLRGQDPVKGALSTVVNANLNAELKDAFNQPEYSGGLPTETPVEEPIETPAEEPYALTTDYGSGANYSLTSDTPQPDVGGLQYAVPESDIDATDINYTPDYSLTPSEPAPDTGGLQYGTTPSLSSMGGGAGLTYEVPGGVVSSAGFTPDSSSPNLGDPNSFINDPDTLGVPVSMVETSPNVWVPSFNFSGVLFGPQGTPLQPTQEEGSTQQGTTAQPVKSDAGALPTSLTPTWLHTTSPDTESTMATTAPTLQQLFPQLTSADPRLLQLLSSRSGMPSYYNYGQPVNTPTSLLGASLGALPSPGIPVRALQSTYNPLGANTASGSNLTSTGLSLLGGSSMSGYAQGGNVEKHNPQFITGKTGHYVQGAGDGQSDSIPAMLADGEYVFDADTVAALGNGSNAAGARALDKLRENLRKHKRSAKPGDIPPPAKSPLAYMKG